MLALLKAQAKYMTLFTKKPKVINTWQNTISQVFHLKSNDEQCFKFLNLLL